MKSPKTEPPKIAIWLLKAITNKEDYYYAIGDIEEIYHSMVRQKSAGFAILWLFYELVRSFPGFIKTTIYWNGVMFGNYLKLTLRNIRKHKGFSSGNIIGLAIAMSCCIFIILWAQFELSYDSFHDNADRLCRVVKHDTDRDIYSTYVAWPLASALKKDYPEFSATTATYPFSEFALKAGENCFVCRGIVADTSFFSVFNMPFIAGSNSRALEDARSIVLTRSISKRLFGDKNPLGEMVFMDWWGTWIDLHVTAVIEDLPDNSVLAFEFLLPSMFITQYGWNLNQWSDNSYGAYTLLEKGVDFDQLNEKISGVLKRYVSDVKTRTIQLQPLKMAHLHHPAGGGDIYKLYIAFAIGLLILFVACINFVNLSMVHWLERSRELSIRKAIGASNLNLAFLCFSQSLVISLIASILALGITQILLPYVKQMLGIELGSIQSLGVFAFLSIISLVVGFAAGIYPDLAMSKVTSSGKPVRKNWMKRAKPRRILVVLQYAVSATIMICAFIAYDQFKYISTVDLGFETDNLIRFKLRGSFLERRHAIKNKLLENPDIKSMTIANGSFTVPHNSTNVSNWEGCQNCDPVNIDIHCADFDYLNTFGVEMIQGNFFSEEKRAEAEQGIILNQAACKAMGISDPVGTTLDCSVAGETRRLSILGVVKDFNIRSLKNEIGPMGIIYSDSWIQYAYVKVTPSKTPQVLDFLRQSLSELAPDFPFDYYILDSEIDELYRGEKRGGLLLVLALFVAIAISSLGLFSLVSYAARLRTKEVAIRKVLGASASRIVALLSREYFLLTGIGYALAVPVAYYAMELWLQDFAYRVDIGLEIFLLTGLATMFIVLVTVAARTIITAQSNPVGALKYE